MDDRSFVNVKLASDPLTVAPKVNSSPCPSRTSSITTVTVVPLDVAVIVASRLRPGIVSATLWKPDAVAEAPTPVSPTMEIPATVMEIWPTCPPVTVNEYCHFPFVFSLAGA